MNPTEIRTCPAFSRFFPAVTWEWAGGDVPERPNRIVTCGRRGEIWDGHRDTTDPVNPLDYLADSVDEMLRVGDANAKRH